MFRSLSLRLATAVLGAAILFGATGTMPLTISQLKQMIESCVERKMQDKEVASFLKQVKLTQRLDDQVIEELQEKGAGPKTIDALKALGDASTSLKPPPPPPAPVAKLPEAPPPDSVKQKELIEAAREYALNYDKQLPNFLCVQVTRRYWDRTGSESWSSLDTITQKLSYYDHQEKYEAISATNVPDDMPLSRLGGLISRGEFGSQMREIFSPEEHADFEWARWGKLRGKLQYVFGYRIEQQYSHYTMAYEMSRGNTLTVTPGYHGLIFLDKDTGLISRLTLEPDVPPTFPVRSARSVLDYDYQQIGEMPYLLPLAASIVSKDRYNVMTKNEIQFRMYRKFGTETIIKFTPEAIPEDQLKEENPNGETKPQTTPPPK